MQYKKRQYRKIQGKAREDNIIQDKIIKYKIITEIMYTVHSWIYINFDQSLLNIPEYSVNLMIYGETIIGHSNE